MNATLPDLEYWRAVIDAADLGVWDYDLASGAMTYSQKWREIRGMKPDQPLPATEEMWLNMLHPEDVATARHFSDMINAGTAKTVAYEYRERNGQGGWTWIMCRGRAVQFDQAGRAIRFVGIDTDVTAMKSLEADRIAAAQQLEIAVDVAEIGVWKLNLATDTITWSDRLRKIYGVAPEENLPRDIWERSLHPDDIERVMALTKRGADSKKPYNLDFRILRRDGDVRHVRSRVTLINMGSDGECFIGVNWDVTDDVRKAEELAAANQIAQERLAQLLVVQRELEYLTDHDPLTGLMNRRAFDDHARKLAPEGAATIGLSVMVIDVDNLKEINDTFGHDVGDMTLKAVANVLQSELGGLGIVARLGGDEFVALMSAPNRFEELARAADSVLAKVCFPVFDDGPTPSVSIGVSTALNEAHTVSQLIRRADRALYRAKSAGRSQVVFA